MEFDTLENNDNEEISDVQESLSSFLEIKLDTETSVPEFTYIPFGKRSFRCTVCNKTFRNEEIAQNHIKNHDTDLVCPTCKLIFKLCDWQQYHLHLKTHRRGRQSKSGNENFKSYICELCAKTFKTRQQLNTHSVTHVEIKLFSCNICEKSFKLKQQLNNHCKIHEDIKPFVCFLCNKAFKLKQQLGNHSKSHSDDRPFPCNFCSKAFKFKQQLQIHLRVHNDLRPFECEVCSHAFKLKQQLQFHMRVHSNERPYSCDMCDKSYKFKQQLKYHLKVHFRDSENSSATENITLNPNCSEEELNLELTNPMNHMDHLMINTNMKQSPAFSESNSDIYLKDLTSELIIPKEEVEDFVNDEDIDLESQCEDGSTSKKN